MSIQAVAWVLEHSVARLADRLVLIAIANHADARGWNAWPAIPLIASEAGVEERTVYRAIDALEASGELIIQRRPGRPNRYGINALSPDNLSGVGGDKLSGEGSHPVRGPLTNGQPNRQEPSKNRRGRAREATDTSPIVSTHPRLPPELPADVRARGAEFFRALRQGDTA